MKACNSAFGTLAKDANVFSRVSAKGPNTVVVMTCFDMLVTAKAASLNAGCDKSSVFSFVRA